MYISRIQQALAGVAVLRCRLTVGYTFFGKIRSKIYVTTTKQISDLGFCKTTFFKRCKKLYPTVNLQHLALLPF